MTMKASTSKTKKKTNKGKKYAKKISLYPLTDEDALLALLKTPPIKNDSSETNTAEEKDKEESGE